MESSDLTANELLRTARRDRGWSHEILADHLTAAAAELGGRYAGIRINPRSIARWEAGERWPIPVNVQLLCRVFGATPEELGLVKRREFLQASAAAAALLGAGGAVSIDWDRISAALVNPRLDQSLLSDLLSVVREQGAQVDRIRPAVLLPLASGHLANLRDLLQRAPSVEPLRAELARIADEQAINVGWIHYNTSNRGAAHASWQLAEDLARESGDKWRVANALGVRSSLHSALPRAGGRGDGRSALAMLDQAIALAGPSAPAGRRSYLLVRRAEERAAFDGPASAAQVARDIEAATEALASGSPRDDLGGGSWGSARLARYRGSAAQLLGRSGEAAGILESTFAQLDPSLIPQRAMALADLAVARARQGEPDEAAAALADAIRIAHSAGITEALHRVQAARPQLDAWGDRPAVRQLDEQLAAIA